MKNDTILSYISQVLEHRPKDWLGLTTHRLDIYEEEFAKVQFLEEFEELFKAGNSEKAALAKLPTAYDYIRLGHPLSCILEWAIAQQSGLPSENVIAFSSRTTPILAVLRTNHLLGKPMHLYYSGDLPTHFDVELVKTVYGYDFEIS